MSEGGNAPRRALFLLHHYNDVDHAVPVAAALLEAGWQVKVLLYPQDRNGSLDPVADWRLNWLRRRGVTVDDLERVDRGFPVIDRLLGMRQRLARWCDRTPFVGRLFGRDIRGLMPHFVAIWLVEHAVRLWTETLSAQGRQTFAAFPADVVAVDWARAHVMVHSILHQARQRGAAIVELPHGAWTYMGLLSHGNQTDPAKLNKKYRLPVYHADAITADNVLGAQRFAARGWRADRLRLVGLPRFTGAWVRTMLAELQPAPFPDHGRLRVVWFAGGITHTEFENALAQTVAALQSVADRVDVVVKLHTRVPAAERAHIERFLAADSPIRVVGGELESIVLTHWADVVLIGQSSAVYDAFLLGKTVLHLYYTQPIDCLWNLFEVGEKLTSAAGLTESLRALADGTYAAAEGPDARRLFMENCVFGGLPEDQVLPAYVSLFEQAAAGAAITAGYGLAESEARWCPDGATAREDLFRKPGVP